MEEIRQIITANTLKIVLILIIFKVYPKRRSPYYKLILEWFLELQNINSKNAFNWDLITIYEYSYFKKHAQKCQECIFVTCYFPASLLEGLTSMDCDSCITFAQGFSPGCQPTHQYVEVCCPVSTSICFSSKQPKEC